ncbi:segregation/condensation protein A [candidate division GN15 bacterium]|nr:segregation/condensation protein A [candidate division GN15 bacterium]
MVEELLNQHSDNYRVNLEVFSGPLDLLLYLIKKEEVDIYDIPIARITQQYLKYIEMMQVLNLEIAGEFILMAATLIRIKARLLLPRDETDTEETDPREELIMALVEYKKYKEASEILREKALIEERNYVPEKPLGKIDSRVELEPGTSLFDLLTAFKEVLEQRRDETVHEVNVEEIAIEDRIATIISMLQRHESATFAELFVDIPRKIVAIVTFLAILELVRTRRIKVMQSEPYARLRIYRGERFGQPREAIDLVDVGALRQFDESE